MQHANMELSMEKPGALVPAASVGTPLQDPKHETFAQHVAAGHSYLRSYLEASGTDNREVARRYGHKLAHEPTIRARIQQLTRAGAERAVHSIAERIQTLADIASTDPSELVRIETVVCAHCWTEDSIAAVLDAGTLPDTTAPRPDCRKGPHRRVTLTATEELSAAGRRLFKGARQKADGSIEVMMHDQLAATRLLAELSGWIIQNNQNLNINANAPLATPAPVSADDVLSAFHALRKVSNP
jgi:hypothetical protein